MKTVLFTWELGEGLGHAAPLVAIADALGRACEARGREAPRFVFAFRDPIFARQALGERSHAVVPAPYYPHSLGIFSEVRAFSEILANAGFARRGDLATMLRAWDDLYRVLNVDLVVADYSPTACLAARGRLPVVVTGNGYAVPPHELASYPALRSDQASSQSQAVLLENANAVLAERGVEPLDRLPRVMEGAARAVFGLPELDAYAAFRQEPVLGSYHPAAPVAPPAAVPRVFYYGQSENRFMPEIVKAIVETGLPVSCFARGPESTSARFLELLGAELFREPPDLARVLPSASLVVSHAGTGISHAALAAGRPQLLIPDHGESLINASRLKLLGVAEIFEPYSAMYVAGSVEDEPRFALRKLIHAMHDKADYRERAHGLGVAIGERDAGKDPLDVAAGLCLDLL